MIKSMVKSLDKFEKTRKITLCTGSANCQYVRKIRREGQALPLPSFQKYLIGKGMLYAVVDGAGWHELIAIAMKLSGNRIPLTLNTSQLPGSK